MARRKTSDKKGTGKESRAANRELNLPNVQADQDSIAIGEINISGTVTGNITIGHTIVQPAESVSVLLNQNRLMCERFHVFKERKQTLAWLAETR